jgi:hypothetical protein
MSRLTAAGLIHGKDAASFTRPRGFNDRNDRRVAKRTAAPPYCNSSTADRDL